MSNARLEGLAAAGGVAVGRAVLLPETPEGASSAGTDEAVAALERVAVELRREAKWLRAEGLGAEAEILDANELMALDPTFIDDVRREAALLPAAQAIARAAERHAAALAALSDPMLAARAEDVRQIARRAARVLAGVEGLPEPDEPSILVARELGPADVAELQASRGDWCGIALARGSATSHAAIMARALGLPMVAGLGPPVLDAAGRTLVIDGDTGIASVSPDRGELAQARARIDAEARRREHAAALRDLPSVTIDGHEVVLLCNAATAEDVRRGLAAGAAGVGLLRTELAFLDARAWPREDEHAAALAQVLDLMRDLKARLNLALLIITHDFGVIAEMADRVAVMYKGRIVEEGPVRQILRDPRHEYTRTLLAAVPGMPSTSLRPGPRPDAR